MRHNLSVSYDINHLLLGPIYVEYIVSSGCYTRYNLPGGALAYAAAGAQVWSLENVGLVSRIGENFPNPIFTRFSSFPWNLAGVRRIPGRHPQIIFYTSPEAGTMYASDPIKTYANLTLAFPSELEDYHSPIEGEATTSRLPPLALRTEDIPKDLPFVRSAFIAPCHISSQIMLSVSLRQRGVSSLLLSPSTRISSPHHLPKLRMLLQDTDVFIASEQQMRSVLRQECSDFQEICDSLSSFGGKTIILQRNRAGFSLFDSYTRRTYFLPFLPIHFNNPMACLTSFCGGFLAGWSTSHDPLEAALYGCVSASLAVEGFGAFFALERNPQLANIRLSALRNLLPV